MLVAHITTHEINITGNFDFCLRLRNFFLNPRSYLWPIDDTSSPSPIMLNSDADSIRSGSGSESGNDAIPSIPPQVLRRIDNAFNRAIEEAREQVDDQLTSERPTKRRKLAQQLPQPAGGFLIKGGDEVTEGGFVPASSEYISEGGDDVQVEGSDDDERSPFFSHIPLSLLPRALQILDLDPSDTATLEVLRNAADVPSVNDPEAWKRDGEGRMEEVVSRRDWRAVCAALLPGGDWDNDRSNEGEDKEGFARVDDLEEKADESESPLSNFDDEMDVLESGTSEDEYVPESSKRASTAKRSKVTDRSRKTGTSTPRRHSDKRSPKLFAGVSEGTQKLSERQEQETVSAFSLFFPDMRGKDSERDEDGLKKRSLTIKDVARAASLIKEKISAEEVRVILMFAYPSVND
jgi:hypothetical protein